MVLMEIVTGRSVDGITQFEVTTNGVAAQVEVAIAHPQVVTAVGIILDGEGRHGRFVQDLEIRHGDLDISRLDVGIFIAALDHGARHLNDELAAQRTFIQTGTQFLAEYQLGDAVAIPQVDKGDGPEFPDGLYPSCEGGLLADMGDAEFSAGMFSVHGCRDCKGGRHAVTAAPRRYAMTACSLHAG